MKIYTLPLGTLQTNCYIVETAQKSGIIIDPGEEGARLLKFMQDKGITPKAIFLTHGHYDHIGAVDELVEAFPEIAIYIGKSEYQIVEYSSGMLKNKQILGIIKTRKQELSDGDSVKIDELELRAVHTPGHSIGGMVYLIGDAMFSGDTLFFEEIGRCDLFTGDYEVMLTTLKKLSQLEGDYTVYPGHEQATTLDHERKHNAYMRKALKQ